MNRPRRTRAALTTLLLALLIAAPVEMTWSVVRQEWLNRALIDAVKRNDDKAVVSLLNLGEVTPWRVVLDWLKGRKSNPANGPTPLMLAVNCNDGPETPIKEHLVLSLIDRGADVNATMNHERAIIYPIK